MEPRRRSLARPGGMNDIVMVLELIKGFFCHNHLKANPKFCATTEKFCPSKRENNDQERRRPSDTHINPKAVQYHFRAVL